MTVPILIAAVGIVWLVVYGCMPIEDLPTVQFPESQQADTQEHTGSPE